MVDTINVNTDELEADVNALGTAVTTIDGIVDTINTNVQFLTGQLRQNSNRNISKNLIFITAKASITSHP